MPFSGIVSSVFGRRGLDDNTMPATSKLTLTKGDVVTVPLIGAPFVRNRHNPRLTTASTAASDSGVEKRHGSISSISTASVVGSRSGSSSDESPRGSVAGSAMGDSLEGSAMGDSLAEDVSAAFTVTQQCSSAGRTVTQRIVSGTSENGSMETPVHYRSSLSKPVYTKAAFYVRRGEAYNKRTTWTPFGFPGATSSEVADADQAEDAEYLASQHEICFITVAAVQLAMELLYDVMFLTGMGGAMKELQLIYKYTWNQRALEQLYHSIFAVQLANTVVYYWVLVTAVASRQSHKYTMFARWSLCSIMWIIALAYMNKFNLIICVLHIALYCYARHMSTLVASLGLLPSARTS